MNSDELIKQVEEVARTRTDGHITLMKFTNGWKAFYGTPDISENRGWIQTIPTSDTAHDAIKALIEDPIDVQDDEDLGLGFYNNM